jgi:hypothetical protein
MSDPSQSVTASVEEACAHVVQAADDLAAVAKKLLASAGALRKAALVGNPSAIANQSQTIAELGPIAARAATVGAGSWSFGQEALTQYMDQRFGSELINRSRTLGIDIDRLEDRYVAFPVVIEIEPKARAVKLNGKRAAGIRPSYLSQQIKSLQAKAGSKPEQFIELLYAAAARVNRENLGISGVLLDEVFDVLTLHPEAKKSYGRADFARDLYVLETSPVKQTRRGAVVSFPAATGTKGSTKTFTVIGPDRHPRHYVGVRFEESYQ